MNIYSNQRSLSSAYKKISEALLKGKAIKISDKKINKNPQQRGRG